MDSKFRRELYELAFAWEEADRSDRRDNYPYRTTLDELMFHATLRFRDYKQFRNDGEFPVRLSRWINNVTSDRDRRALFQLLPWIIFIDRQQMLSLYRDAYRRIIAPWISHDILTLDDMLAVDYPNRLIEELRQYSLHSVTESFALPDFLQVNDLGGLPKPRSFDEDVRQIPIKLPAKESSYKGILVLEDCVGTGKQVSKILAALRKQIGPNKRILFVPLLILEVGLEKLQLDPALTTIDIFPVLTIPTRAGISPDASQKEPPDRPRIRAVIKKTAGQVLRALDATDDPPTNAFGYKGCGATLVTCHNTPNNTLPLLHHKSPNWSPLFRRLHHSKEGL